MSGFRVLVVDDEPLARGMVSQIVEQDPDVTSVTECGDGREAVAVIRRTRPQIVFLDIEMPEVDGLQVVDALDPDELPAFVFVTAHGHHAARAFEVEALDYVLKPFSDQRLVDALQRAKRRVRERRLSELAGKVARVSAELTGAPSAPPGGDRPAFLQRLTVSDGEGSRIVRSADIIWIEAQDYYARIHSTQGRHLLRASLATLDARLDPASFVRAHRRAIVSLDAVETIRPLAKGSRVLVLVDGTRLPVSRARWSTVEAALRPRLGARG